MLELEQELELPPKELPVALIINLQFITKYHKYQNLKLNIVFFNNN